MNGRIKGAEGIETNTPFSVSLTTGARQGCAGVSRVPARVKCWSQLG